MTLRRGHTRSHIYTRHGASRTGDQVSTSRHEHSRHGKHRGCLMKATDSDYSRENTRDPRIWRSFTRSQGAPGPKDTTRRLKETARLQLRLQMLVHAQDHHRKHGERARKYTVVVPPPDARHEEPSSSHLWAPRPDGTIGRSPNMLRSGWVGPWA